MPTLKIFNVHYNLVQNQFPTLSDVINFETVSAEQLAQKWLQAIGQSDFLGDKINKAFFDLMSGRFPTDDTKAAVAYHWAQQAHLWSKEDLSLPMNLVNWIILASKDANSLENILVRLSDYTEVDKRAAKGRTSVGFDRISKPALQKLIQNLESCMEAEKELAKPGVVFLITAGKDILSEEQFSLFKDYASQQAEQERTRTFGM